jgi:MPBQ/MSBQ methyltransferase
MADNLEQSVARHYGRDGLKEKVLAGIAAAGLDVDRLKADDLAPVDEFHTGGRLETVHALGKIHLRPTDHVLDVGCGLGGTTRYIANFGCRVKGIDLTPEYVELAKILSEKTGFAGRIEYETASALQMPFDDASFDAAITFHVAMNIKDRPALYGEIARVLKTRAVLCIYDVMKGAHEGLTFPVPWAEAAANSHLTSADEMHKLLAEAGFEVTEVEDRSAFAIDFFRKRLASVAPAPALGLHLLTGENSQDKFENYLRSVEAGTIAPTIMIAKRI